MGDAQGGEFRNTQTTAIKGFKNGTIALSIWGGWVWSGDETIYLVNVKNGGELALKFWGFNQFRGVVEDDFFE